MTNVEKYGLSISGDLHDFIVNEAIPGTGVDPDAFLTAFADAVHELGPKNRMLLKKRDELQVEIDA